MSNRQQLFAGQHWLEPLEHHVECSGICTLALQPHTLGRSKINPICQDYRSHSPQVLPILADIISKVQVWLVVSSVRRTSYCLHSFQLFAIFAPILGNPKDDNLTALCEVLTPLLLSIPYDEDGMAPLHNLISIIELPATYLTTSWHAAFPGPARPARYDAAIANDATPIVRACMEATHNTRLVDYASFEATELTFVKFICDVIDEIWHKDLKILALSTTWSPPPRSSATSTTTAGGSTRSTSLISLLR